MKMSTILYYIHWWVVVTAQTRNVPWGRAVVEGPLWEPPLTSFFKPLQEAGFEYQSPQDFVPKAKIVRRRGLSKEEFGRLVRLGQPFVVDDCVEGSPMLDMPCSDYGEKWPTGKMKAEYSDGQPRVSLGDARWHQQLRPASAHKDHLSFVYGPGDGKRAPRMGGPYVWHVKDEEPLETKRGLQKFWQTPYFLNDTKVNEREARDSFEMWFALPNGGAMAHADAYNEMTISVQLKGRKTWRLGMFPEVPTVFDSFNSHDAGIYGAKKWRPEYEFEVGPGECFVFPPGYIHETYVRPDQNTECTVATTFQYNVPFASKYVRTFLPRLFNSHLVWQEQAVEIWAGFAQITHEEILPVVVTDEDIAKRVSDILDVIDVNNDEIVVEKEFRNFYLHHPEGAWSRQKGFAWLKFEKSKELKKTIQRELAENRAGDCVMWHDIDEDGQVTRAELEVSTKQWNVLLQKYQALRKLNPKKKKSAKKALDIELFFLKKYGCPAEGTCEELDKLAKRKVSSLHRLELFEEQEPEEDFESINGQGDSNVITDEL